MNKSILIIPDIHGRTFWKVAIDSGEYGKVIFLGDYVDPYEREGISVSMALNNFNEIIALKEQYPDKVILLLGNHDLHYYSEHYCELAQSSRYSHKAAITLQRLFQEKKNLFQLVWETDLDGKHYLFSHAGINQSWLNRNIGLIRVPDERHLNRLLLTDEGIETLAQVGSIRCGNYPTGSIVWADVDEILASDPLPGTYQIFGHTQQYDGPIITAEFACLDCRAAFSLDQKGEIKPITRVVPYNEQIIW